MGGGGELNANMSEMWPGVIAKTIRADAKVTRTFFDEN